LNGYDNRLRHTPSVDEGDTFLDLFVAPFREWMLSEFIVSKRRGSRYVSGRTRAWLKTKHPTFPGCESPRAVSDGQVAGFSLLLITDQQGLKDRDMRRYVVARAALIH
jgi:hypothetical protein